MEQTLSQALVEYIDQRKQTKLEPLQKALAKVVAKGDEIAIAQAKVDYAEKAAPIEATFEYETWLTTAAKRAKQISLATHAIKFTHSDAKASSVLLNEFDSEQQYYLTTRSLSQKAIDAVGNAAALDVAKFLKIQCQGESLITQLQAGIAPALKVFSQDEVLLQSWIDGFKLALTDENLTSHSLSKQLYFPVADTENETDYHLLMPLFSSALTHQLHAKVTATRFGESKDIRDARKARKYDSRMDVSFPKTAVQTFGGSKPQNISQLNSERYGQAFLLNCAPPAYQVQAKPPINQQTIFNRQFSYQVSGYLREFKRFLESLRPNERNFKVRYKRDHAYILPIIDRLLSHAAIIQTMPAAWSETSDCKLKLAHALWLDVLNPNDKFQQQRAQLNWLKEVADDFAKWLIQQLKSEQYLMADIEHNYFAKLCLHQLKSFERSTPKLNSIKYAELDIQEG